MSTDMPLKRHPSIQALSRDHHHTLLLCWKIKTGFEREVDINRIKKYADWFYKNHLESHFSQEETLLFPILGYQNSMVKQAIDDHKHIAALFADTNNVEASLKQIESLLAKHVRFEERTLYNAIQAKATEEQLKEIAKNSPLAKFTDNLVDPFWA